jgi:probable F420-dependent oxidoreductase
MPFPDLAVAAEERDFESIWVAEHSHIPVSRRTPWPGGGELPKMYYDAADPFVVLSMAAAATTRLKLATGICLVVQRDPIQTAKEVASIDHLSGGRFEFGVGAGWNREEMANHGTDPRRRMTVLRERVEAMKQIWAQDEASYHGEFVDFERIWSWPKPSQRPHPPVLVGGGGPTVFDRVLAYGNAWFPNYAPDVVERAAELRHRADRPIDLMVMGIPADPKVIEQYEVAGFRRIVHWLPSAGKSVVERTIERFETAVDEVHGH